MDSVKLHRDLGRVEGEVRALRRDLESVAEKLDETNDKLDTALSYISQKKGERRATIGIATAVATFVGFVAGIAGTWFK